MEKLFLGIGAMKAGTTWVYSMLETHPQLHFTPEKEIHLLAHLYSDRKPLTQEHRQQRANTRLSRISNLRPERQKMMRAWYEERYLQGAPTPTWYSNLFADRAPRASGWNCDFSNLSALIPSKGWRAIRREIAGQIQAVYILRHPCERLWSQYKFSHKDDIDLEKVDLVKAFLDSHEANHHSCYCQNIDAACEGLGRENVNVLIFDDIKTNPERFLESIENFLGITNKHYLDHKNLRRKINHTATNPPPESFENLCREITERELSGLTKRNIQFPDHWADRLGGKTKI